jgi:phenylpropionate dioxygenase-like ring-hydroxylating dioxygenase large terminal subunit
VCRIGKRVSIATREVSDALAHGATVPASWYSDPAVLDLERDRIFAHAWQCVGSAADVAEPGSYVAGFAGHIPVVAVRDGDGTLRAFVNVCRHRGHLVADGAGRRSTLQCPYHAWTYGLDGSLRSAPRCEREPGFDMAGLSLVPVQVETWGPLLFVNAHSDTPPLADVLGDLDARVAEAGVELGRLRRRSRGEWELAANWKIGLENYLECYHCPVAHPGFSKLLDVDPDAYVLCADGVVLSQFAPVREGARDAPYVPDGPLRQAQYHYVWPNLTINVEAGPMNMSVDVWRPVTPELTLGWSEYYFADDVSDAAAEEIIAFSTQVGQEDDALVESVQRGLASGMVSHGRLLPTSERLIGHFQRLVFDALASR